MKISHLIFLSILVFLFNPACQKANLNKKSSFSNEKTCVEKVIDADNLLGTERNHDCEEISLSKTIKKYVEGMRKLSFGGCPTSFSTAFQSHINAWENMISITDHYPDLRGEMHELFDIIEKGDQAKSFKIALADIWDTWADVEKATKQ